MVDLVEGLCEPAFEGVRRAFAADFAAGDELGAGFAVWCGGRCVVDLTGGFADRARTRTFRSDTLTPVFSTTKAVTAIMLARLVDAGRLAYEAPVSSVWPEFAQGGKAAVTVEQVLSHQAGLPGFIDPMAPELWFDWEAITARLAAMTPMWPPGTASGYHPVTFGYLAGEIFRRVDGRTLGAALAQDVAGPLGLDLWIGLPDAEHARVAEVAKPRAQTSFGELNAATRAAFLTPWASPGGRGTAAWRRAEIPSANGHATAAALAHLMGVLVDGGEGDGVRVLSPQGVAAMARRRICGQDLVLKNATCWGAGVMRNEGRFAYGPDPESFGHSGWGGSCAFADPAHRLGVAYVMNRQSTDLVADPRAQKLIASVYACLGSPDARSHAFYSAPGANA